MSLFRRRERFDRSDVPTASPLRSVVSAVVIVLVVVLSYALVTTLWRRAHQVGGIGSGSLRSSVASQPSGADPDEGYASSGHDVDNTLILMAAEDGLLSQAQVLSIDHTSSTALLVAIPPDARLSASDAVVTLSALYTSEGGAACVSPLATATNLHLGHVVESPVGLWERLDQLQGPELLVLLGPAADVLETLTTDMSSGDLIAWAEAIRALGITNVQHVDAPTYVEQLEDGRTVSVIDRTQLGLRLGTLVAVNVDEGGDAGTPSGAEGEA